jgi:hypothetical protein
MECVRRLGARDGSEMSRGPELISRKLDHSDSSAPRQQELITLCELTVSRAKRHYQNFEQRQRRSHQLPLAFVCSLEERQDEGQESWFLLDEVNED